MGGFLGLVGGDWVRYLGGTRDGSSSDMEFLN
jgi:hypothetical protein